jgi:hypothetical protein
VARHLTHELSRISRLVCARCHSLIKLESSSTGRQVGFYIAVTGIFTDWRCRSCGEEFVRPHQRKTSGTVVAARSALTRRNGGSSCPNRFRRLLYAEPLRRRMRVRFGAKWIADMNESGIAC